MICLYENGNYTPLVNSIDNEERVYKYTNNTQQTVNIICSYSTSYKRAISIVDDIVSQQEFNDTIYNKLLSKKTSVVTRNSYLNSQEAILDLELYVEDEYTDKNLYKFNITSIGYYANNNFIGIQGNFISENVDGHYQYTIRVGTSSVFPKGIQVFNTDIINFEVIYQGSSSDAPTYNILGALVLTLDFDKLSGFDRIFCDIIPYKLSSYNNSEIYLKNELKQINYPYSNKEYNTIKSNIVSGLKQGFNPSISTLSFDDIEENKLSLEITRTTDRDWSYYWTKQYNYMPAGKYCAFIKAKWVTNNKSPMSLIVFSTGGSTIAIKEITNLLSDEEFILFSCDFSIDSTKQIMVGVAQMAASSAATIGDILEISLIGLVKDRTSNSLGSDIYTLEDKKDYYIRKLPKEPLSYPYSLNINNIITSEISVGLVSTGNISWGFNKHGGFGDIEKSSIDITITNPASNDWGYYWTKDYGVKLAGKYCAFIRAKQVDKSPINLVVFSTGGGIVAIKDITKEISSEYKIFTIEFEITESKRLMVGVTSGQRVYNQIVIGDTVSLSLIGLAKDRTESNLLSDIYTLDDYKTVISIQSNNIEEIATMAIFEGIPVMGIIGDSLSSGVTYNGTELITNYNYAWWRVLERDSGQKYIPFARGGLTTRSWLSNYLSSALQAENKCCAYIIGLQVNDAYSLGESYLGSPEDIDINDYNNNADTYYGNYAKIIQALTENNPKCKFFLFTEPRKTGEADSLWNGAVRYIANLFNNCYLVDLQDMYNSLYLNGFIKNTIGPQAHYPSIAYSYMGKLIEKAIGETIKQNANDFKYIQFALE